MDELSWVDAEHLGEFENVVQGDVALPSFHLADVAPVQAGVLRQLLLALAELPRWH